MIAPKPNDAVLGGTITLGTMPISKAEEIVGAMLKCSFHDMGLEDDDVPRPPWPSQYSLEELCIAARIVSEHPGTVTPEGTSKMMTIADRGIAAKAAFDGYHGDIYALLESLGYHISNGEDDE